MPTAQAFRAAIGRAASDDTGRAVLLTGAGKRFCAGGDVAAFASFESAEDQRDYLVGLAHELDAANQELAALEKPVVAHVQGAVAGSGLSVMLSCDLIVAAEGTKFVIAYPGVGLVPDVCCSWLLPRAIGKQRALHLALTNKPIGSDVALDWGLVTDRKSVVEGKSVSVSLDLGGRRIIKKTNTERKT